MRDVSGRLVRVGGDQVYVEEAGGGEPWVVFESGMGAGRTTWDRVLPLVTDVAHTLAYDRIGRGRSPLAARPQSLDEMAGTLVGLVAAVVPAEARMVLVGHSMGGLIVRRAAERLAPRLSGLLLVDPTAETAPVFDDYPQSATNKRMKRALQTMQTLTRFRPLTRLATARYRQLFGTDSYEVMLAEDFTPGGQAQSRREWDAFVDGVGDFRSRPPKAPGCEIVVISATRANRAQAPNHAILRDHQRRQAEQLGARFEDSDSDHLVTFQQPDQIASAIRRLLPSPVSA